MAVPLSCLAVWTVMATRLMVRRSRLLLLLAGVAESAGAEREAADLRWWLAVWLERRALLGRVVLARGGGARDEGRAGGGCHRLAARLPEAARNTPAREGAALWRRSALASTLLARLEPARNGAAVLEQERPFGAVLIGQA